jgi:hypothetical protein
MTKNSTGGDKAPKLYIVYTGAMGVASYEVSAPYGWEHMTPKERTRWARSVLRRKDSTWAYVQIDGHPY